MAEQFRESKSAFAIGGCKGEAGNCVAEGQGCGLVPQGHLLSHFFHNIFSTVKQNYVLFTIDEWYQCAGFRGSMGIKMDISAVGWLDSGLD